MYTIIGSGFGLYGYLPALLTYLNEEIVLPINYQEKIISRPELASMLYKVRWVDDRDQALAIADTVILAIPPSKQSDTVSHCLSLSTIKRFVLEKPMASEPIGAAKLHNKLVERNVDFSVAYTLAHASWQSGIKWPTSSDTMITLTWNFMAHHFAHNLNNWKRSHKYGGGVLRFYGVHVIAMLAQRGYTEAQTVIIDGKVSGEPEIWQAIFNGINKPTCRVNINSRSIAQCFNIRSEDNISLLALPEPFALEDTKNNLDKRVAILAKILDRPAVKENFFKKQEWYALTNHLWKQVENSTLV